MFNISFYNIVLDVFNGQINGYKIKITQDWSTVSDCCLNLSTKKIMTYIVGNPGSGLVETGTKMWQG
jgi:sporulation protein YlmC with PRC-barrel domain